MSFLPGLKHLDPTKGLSDLTGGAVGGRGGTGLIGQGGWLGKVQRTASAPLAMVSAADPLLNMSRGKNLQESFNPDKSLNRGVQALTANDGLHRAVGMSDHTFNKTNKVAAAVAGLFFGGAAAYSYFGGAPAGASSLPGSEGAAWDGLSGTYAGPGAADYGGGTLAGYDGGGVDSSLFAGSTLTDTLGTGAGSLLSGAGHVLEATLPKLLLSGGAAKQTGAGIGGGTLDLSGGMPADAAQAGGGSALLLIGLAVLGILAIKGKI